MDDNTTNPSRPSLLSLPYHLQKMKCSLFALLFYFPPSLLVLVLLVLLAYNSASIFCVQVHFPAEITPESHSFSLENANAVGDTARKWSSSSSSLSSSVMYAVKEEIPPSKLKSHLPLLQEPKSSSVLSFNSFPTHRPRRSRKNKMVVFKHLQSSNLSRQFSVRVNEFFHGSYLNSSNSSYCKEEPNS
uniref:Uncharacterized protein n=1 Tax=Nelumbo nucifera TaxID=4432 RepID=A0A822XV31_NELNU|nr:TPA_asm: hypothetical protein HUJ06_024412 [Nelumbo nucifera]